MPRDRGIAMSQLEIRRLLDGERTIMLATIAANGVPHLSAMWYVRVDDTLLMWTNGSSQKACNLVRDPRASVSLEAGYDHTELHGFCLECSAEVVTDFDTVRRFGSTIYARYFQPSDDTDRLLDKEARRRIGIRLSIERSRTWDHRRLGR